MAKRTLYDVLQVSRNADPETIKAAYKSLVQRYHPDKNPDEKYAEELLKDINYAYEVLSDPVKRAEYDAELAEGDARRAGRTSVGQGGKSTSSNFAGDSSPRSNHDLYKAYLGEKNQSFYLEKFELFDRLGDGLHPSWSWGALFGFNLWALYRKMYLWFFFITVISAIFLSIEVRTTSALPLLLDIVIIVAFIVFSNSLYHRKVKSEIATAKIVARNDDELINLLRGKGGVHTWVWWILWVWLAVAVIGIIAAIVIPTLSDKKTSPHAPEPAYSYKEEQRSESSEQSATNTPEQRSERMRQYYSSNDYDGVIREASSGSFMNSELNILGVSLYNNGRYKEAATEFSEAERLFPFDHITKSNLADALIADGDDQSALQKYREALTLAPNDTYIKQRLKDAEQIVEDRSRANQAQAANEKKERETRRAQAESMERERLAREAKKEEDWLELEEELARRKKIRMEQTRLMEERDENRRKEEIEAENAGKNQLSDEQIEENNRKWLNNEKKRYMDRDF